MKNRYAEILYGKVLYIFETDLPFEKLSTIFNPATYWVDVTGMKCEVGYIASFKEGVGIVLTEPPNTEHSLIEEQAAEMKLTLQNLAVNAMMATLAGSDITTQQTEYQSSIAVLSDDVALLMPEVYPVWSADSVEYKKDDRVTYNGVLYKVLTAHTSQETWKPDVSPSLFVKVISSISGEIPEWQQPSADNAYMKGDKVRYNGKIYESLIDNNVWAPDAYPDGWKEVTEN